MNRRIAFVMVIGLSLGALPGCFMIAGAAAGATARNVDPKAPKAETAANCQSWECWDGYACGLCEGRAEAKK